MTHPEEESLVELALGEPVDATVSEHVEGCVACRASVDRTHDVIAATTRLGGEQLVLERPPAHVWDAIQGGGTAPPARERTVAVGTVRPFAPASTTKGLTRVVQDGSARSLRVDLTSPPRTDGAFVQAWLLDPRTNHMIALGVMDRRSERFAIPAQVDLRTYDKVDLSLEPYDGNPAHSAVSLARGSLRSR